MFEQSDCEVVSLSGFWRISYVFPRMVIFKQSQVVSNQKFVLPWRIQRPLE
jgi:hypothetical protein